MHPLLAQGLVVCLQQDTWRIDGQANASFVKIMSSRFNALASLLTEALADGIVALDCITTLDHLSKVLA